MNTFNNDELYILLRNASHNAETVNGHTVETDVPADAKFTDTTNSDITSSGNPVIMDGLQGGVPFSGVIISGKNLIPYPYYNTTKTVSGVTLTDNGDGSVTLTGTSTAYGSFNFTSRLNFNLQLKGTFTISGATKDAKIAINATRNGIATTIVRTQSNATFDCDYNDNDNQYGFAVFLEFDANKTFNDVVIYPQLEVGDTATAYEPPITGRELTLTANDIKYTITPDSNPYTVLNDIRQQDGINVISASEGTLSVTCVRKNAAVKKIWDKLDELTTAIIVSNGETE